MVLISSLYLFQDARSWPDKVHDGMLLGLAPGWPWLPLAWPVAGPRLLVFKIRFVHGFLWIPVCTMDLKQKSPSDGATAQDDSKWPEFYSLL